MKCEVKVVHGFIYDVDVPNVLAVNDEGNQRWVLLNTVCKDLRTAISRFFKAIEQTETRFGFDKKWVENHLHLMWKGNYRGNDVWVLELDLNFFRVERMSENTWKVIGAAV